MIAEEGEKKRFDEFYLELESDDEHENPQTLFNTKFEENSKEKTFAVRVDNKLFDDLFSKSAVEAFEETSNKEDVKNPDRKKNSLEYNKEKALIFEKKRLPLFALALSFTKYTLTNKRLIINDGFFKKTEKEILLYRITDIKLTRTIFQRIFKLATITIDAKGGGMVKFSVKDIQNYKKFKDVLFNEVEKEKIRYGIHAEEMNEKPYLKHNRQNRSNANENYKTYRDNIYTNINYRDNNYNDNY